MCKILYSLAIVAGLSALTSQSFADVKSGLDALNENKFEEALKAFDDAFQKGEPDGGFYLARMVELGIGIAANPQAARVVYQAAADKGSAKAMNRIGVMYYRGEPGVLQDYTEAFKLICEAADQGEKEALANCGEMHTTGKGTPKDVKKGHGYYEKASEAGHTGALNTLGLAYKDGTDVEKDLVKAQSYFERSAAEGNPIGLFELAFMYENGKPIAKDIVKAHIYYNLSSARGLPKASQALQRVVTQMSPEEIAKAQTNAKDWKPKQ